jgi:hypothetical protein
MTITEQLEGLLPADGPMTKTDRIIAEAVGELRKHDADGEFWIGVATEQHKKLLTSGRCIITACTSPSPSL